MIVLNSILAMELALRIEAGSPLRARLHAIVARHPTLSSYQDKWAMYRQAAELLDTSLHLATMGCWDFFDDNERALRDFEMWSNGMITREGARTAPQPGAGGPYRSAEPLFMTFTMALLMRYGSPCERHIGQLCAIPEAHLWHRATFSRILRGIPSLSFARVRADVAYLIPGNDAWGLSAADLRLPKFHYLRPIVG